MANTTAISSRDEPVVLVDGFAKAILIIIAVLLGILVVNYASKIAKAEPKQCGDASNPCFVRIVNH